VEKTKEKVSEARERILGTALHLFYSQGIRATGIDTIIRDSGVAKMTFYKHFPSKQTLVMEVLRRGEELWLSNFHGVVDPIKDPRKRLLAIFDFLSVWFKDPGFRGCAYINTTVEAADPKAQECVAASQHKQILVRFLKETAREAGFDKKRADELAAKLLLLFDGAIVRALMEKSAEPAHTAKSIAATVLESVEI
jgi:AcrR family transcriptional regulator